MPKAIDITLDVDSDGNISRTRSRWLRDYIKLFAGGKVRIRISRPKRSSAANSYYWGAVIRPIREALLDAGRAVSADTLHRLFKQRYLDVETDEVFGEPVTLPPTTTKLDQTEFHYYCEAIKQDPDVLALGVYFEEPDDEAWRSHNIAEPA